MKFKLNQMCVVTIGQFHHYDISNEVIHRVNAYRNVFKFISAYLQCSTVIIMALQGLQYLSWALPFFLTPKRLPTQLLIKHYLYV